MEWIKCNLGQNHLKEWEQRLHCVVLVHNNFRVGIGKSWGLEENWL